MFSGIIEAVAPVQKIQIFDGAVRIHVKKPGIFNDLKIGDSIAVNGICLTVESFDEQEITFALAAETLQVLGLKPTAGFDQQVGQNLNLERSLRFGDRIHGHLVSGHVDSMGMVVGRKQVGESLFLEIEVKDSILPFVWKKGSITFNGTSLTVNSVEGHVISVCLIPETQKRTNLSILQVGDRVTVEPDYMAKVAVMAMRKGMEL